MSDAGKQAIGRARPSAAELRRMPTHERDAILEAQAALAEDVYRQDHRLTDFEAFGEEALHGDRPSAEAG